MTLLAVILLGIGILLIYAAVKNRHPVELVKAVLQGETSDTPLVK